MLLPVKLQAVVDEMDTSNDELRAYINRKTGELASCSEYDLPSDETAEDDALVPDWQAETIATTREVLASDDFIELPDGFEINEYSIMQRFCQGIADMRVRDALITAISGRGAFRRFKDQVHREGIADDWYAFRNAAMCEIAAGFLRDEGIPFVCDEPPADDTDS